MRRRACAVSILVLLASISLAQEDRTDPAAVIAEARKVHLDLAARGLESFTVEIALRRSADANLRRYKHLATFGYAWTAPGPAEFDFTKTHEKLQKSIRDVLRDMWRDVTGVMWFDVLAKAGDLRLAIVDSHFVVTGTIEGGTEVRASFETGSRKQVGLEAPKANARVDLMTDQVDGGFRVVGRKVFVNDAPAYRIGYGAFRTVSGFELPTSLEVWTSANSTEYRIRWLTVNGKPAVMKEIPDEVVKTRVAAFEDGWREWDDLQRIAAIEDLSSIDHDLVSAAIARRGLRDRSPDVRVCAAEALGVMKRGNAVPALIAAMRQNEKEIEIYVRMIEALGEIGDPRAVDILSKDWWNQRIGEYGVAAAKAKIRALGNIRHADAVDALISTFFVMKDDSVKAFAEDIIVSLMKLTGQDFKYDRRAWKDWWKANRGRHRFE